MLAKLDCSNLNENLSICLEKAEENYIGSQGGAGPKIKLSNKQNSGLPGNTIAKQKFWSKDVGAPLLQLPSSKESCQNDQIPLAHLFLGLEASRPLQKTRGIKEALITFWKKIRIRKKGQVEMLLLNLIICF